ncbi:hypothetical protein LCGC14_0147190 [marine sediment metagenome]|uniref:Uncharacterized protein n=1 Tax=marine sediment metagenome TaxID=412755 RepID=A0A0F9VFP0_9ZZZZ
MSKLFVITDSVARDYISELSDEEVGTLRSSFGQRYVLEKTARLLVQMGMVQGPQGMMAQQITVVLSLEPGINELVKVEIMPVALQEITDSPESQIRKEYLSFRGRNSGLEFAPANSIPRPKNP